MRRAVPFLLILPLAQAAAAPLHYALPPETATLAPGPGRDAAEICSACHSVDYIVTQPRPLQDPHGFWAREVKKMQHVFGAPIDDASAATITAYLAATYK